MKWCIYSSVCSLRSRLGGRLFHESLKSGPFESAAHNIARVSEQGRVKHPPSQTMLCEHGEIGKKWLWGVWGGKACACYVQACVKPWYLPDTPAQQLDLHHRHHAEQAQ